MQGWWGAPDYGVPTCQWQGKRGATCTEQLRHGVNTSISYNTQHSFTGVVSGLYLRSVCCRNGPSSMRCRGSRRSRVDGSGTSRRRSRVVVEVDVHGRRGSSGTRSFFGEVLDESNIFGATVVVHTTSGYLLVRFWRCRCTCCRGLSHHRV